jgi:hypothetical protein
MKWGFRLSGMWRRALGWWFATFRSTVSVAFIFNGSGFEPWTVEDEGITPTVFTHQYCMNIHSIATLFLTAVTLPQTTLQYLHSTEVRIRRDEARERSLNLAWTVTRSSRAFRHVITRHQPSTSSLAQCVYWNLTWKSKHKMYKCTTYAVSNGHLPYLGTLARKIPLNKQQSIQVTLF